MGVRSKLANDGSRILRDALGWHVRPDGLHFEQASYYHRHTADIYTHFYLLARQGQSDLAESIRPKLEALLEHLMWITRPDGTTPYLGSLLVNGKATPCEPRQTRC